MYNFVDFLPLMSIDDGKIEARCMLFDVFEHLVNLAHDQDKIVVVM